MAGAMSGRGQAAAVLLAAALLWSAVSTAASASAVDLLPGAVLLACEPAVVDVGEASAAWALVEGFYPAESAGDRSFAWTEREFALRLVAASDAARTLRLVARAGPRELRLAARLNGAELGVRAVPGDWSAVSWEVPAGGLRQGVNRLALRASADAAFPPDPRSLAVAVDRVELVPAAVCAGAAAATVVAEGEAPTLAPGAFLLLPVSWPPSARLAVRAAGAPGTRLRLDAFGGDGQEALGAVQVGEDGEVAASLAGAPCCRPGAGLVARAEGPGPVRVDELRLGGEDGPLAWRAACGLLVAEPLLALAAFALLVALVRFLPSPATRGGPWLDAALVVAIALAVRLAFLAAYPGQGRSADAYEYLLRAGRLAAGRVSFLHDTGWHAWQTWIRPPGYYLFLAATIGPLGGGVQLAIALQVLFSALTAGATALIGSRLFGRGAGLAAGLVSALYLEAVVTVPRILTEPLYMVLLVPALAALTWAAARPTWRVAALAGALFGLAALVRSAPVYYVPLAAGLLVAIHGWRPARRAALTLVAALIVVILPWCVRNSLVYGTVMGIDDLAVANLLQVSPNDRFVPVDDLDLDSEKGMRDYYNRLQRANRDRSLSRQAGAVLRATVANFAGHPLVAVKRFAVNLGSYFAFYPSDFFRRIVAEDRPCRVALYTDLMNAQYVLLLAFAVAGFVLSWRDRRSWPLVLWFVFNAAIINLLFHPEFKYRMPTLPVLMVFAGVAIARLLGWMRGRGARTPC